MTNLIKTDTTPIGENLPSNHSNVLLDQWIQEQKEEFPLIKTGLDSLDNIIGGIFKMSIVGGGPATGKTTLAIQTAIHYAKEGGPVFYLSFEQGPDGFFGKVYQRLTGKKEKDHRQYIKDNPNTLETMKKEIKSMDNLIIDGLPTLGKEYDFDKLIGAVNDAQDATNKTALIVIDSLHYMPLGEKYNNLDGKRKIDKSLEILTAIQQTTKAAILMIAHQTKSEVKDKSNDLMSFSGSGTIAYAVDIAIQLTRDIKTTPENLEVTVPKNRLGGPYLMPIILNYNLPFQTLTSN